MRQTSTQSRPIVTRGPEVSKRLRPGEERLYIIFSESFSLATRALHDEEGARGPAYDWPSGRS
jgi:hypothetical protein